MDDATPRFTMYTMDEIVSLPPPSREEEYRRGYRDGWRMATDAIAEAVMENKVPIADAYERARQHGLYALLSWMRSEQSARFIAPRMDTARTKKKPRTAAKQAREV